MPYGYFSPSRYSFCSLVCGGELSVIGSWVVHALGGCAEPYPPYDYDFNHFIDYLCVPEQEHDRDEIIALYQYVPLIQHQEGKGLILLCQIRF